MFPSGIQYNAFSELTELLDLAKKNKCASGYMKYLNCKTGSVGRIFFILLKVFT